MPAKNWPPPGFPLVEGDYALTRSWWLHLPERFARRVEEGSLVLWRPGLTVWLAAWDNNKGQPQAERLAWIKARASLERFAERESSSNNVSRFSYRLRDQNEDGPVESLNAYVIGDDGHLQVAIYFDDLADEARALQLVDSIAERGRA